MNTRPKLPLTNEQRVREEFTEARRITRVSWSEREVLQALDRAEAVALQALGITPHPPSKKAPP